MSQLFLAFGIDWRLLLVNSINFGLLLWVLYHFLYGPLTRMLEERRLKVAKGVQDAHDAAERLKEIEAARAGMLANAGKEADEVLKTSREAALAQERAIKERAEAAAANVAREAQMQAAEEKARAIAESKQEVAKLVVLGIERMQKA